MELQVDLDAAPSARFTAWCDGWSFRFDPTFTVTAGRWIGADIGVFATAPLGGERHGMSGVRPVRVKAQ